MFSKICYGKKGNRIEFYKESYGDQITYFFIEDCVDTLLEKDISVLNDLMALFPHPSSSDTSDSGWPVKFSALNIINYEPRLLKLAANAYSENGHPMISVAAEYGDLEHVQKLVKMGADINKAGKDGKVALHWAIDNKNYWSEVRHTDKTIEVLKFLLDEGARLDMKLNYYCKGQDILEYAQDRAKTIKEIKEKRRSHFNLYETTFSFWLF